MDLENLIAETQALHDSIVGGMRVLDDFDEQAWAHRRAEERRRADKERLEAQRKQHENERAFVAQLEVQGRDRVVLDVGGTHFATTRQTLAAVPGSMLDAWFSGRHAIKARPDGTVFIDRSPEMFGNVLDLLRTGSQTLRMPSSHDEIASLQEQLDYFMLSERLPPTEAVIDCYRPHNTLEFVVLKDRYTWGNVNSAPKSGTQRRESEPCIITRPARYFLGGTDQYANTDEYESAGLWDTVSGEMMKKWPMETQHGSMMLCTASPQHVCAVYGPAMGVKDAASMHVVVSNIETSSPMSPTAPTESRFVLPRGKGGVHDAMLMGSEFVVLRTDAVEGWDIHSGQRLWQAEIDGDVLTGCERFSRNFSDEVFVVATKPGCLVFHRGGRGGHAGGAPRLAQTVSFGDYSIEFFEENAYSGLPMTDCMPMERGGGVRVLKAFQYPGHEIIYSHLICLDGRKTSTNGLPPCIPLRQNLGVVANFEDGEESWGAMRFHSPDVLYRFTRAGLHFFRYDVVPCEASHETFSNSYRFELAESILVRMDHLDWYSQMDAGAVVGNVVVTSGKDGTVRVWRPRSKKNRSLST